MSDIVFWYTGWLVWAGISVLILIAVICGVIKSYYAARDWRRLWNLFGAPEDLRNKVLHAMRDSIDSDELHNTILKCAKKIDKYNLNYARVEDFNDADDKYDLDDEVIYRGDKYVIVGVSHFHIWNTYELSGKRFGRIDGDNVRIINVTAHDLDQEDDDL